MQLAIKATERREVEHSDPTIREREMAEEEEAIRARLRFYNCPRMCVSE